MCNMKKIFAVDDHIEWLNFYKSILPEYFDDFSYTTAMSAKEGIKTVDAHPDNYFDFILSDLEMETDTPERCAGMYFIKNILHKTDKKKITIISASFNIDSVAKELGVKYIAKRSLVHNPYLIKKIEDIS